MTPEGANQVPVISSCAGEKQEGNLGPIRFSGYKVIMESKRDNSEGRFSRVMEERNSVED